MCDMSPGLRLRGEDPLVESKRDWLKKDTGEGTGKEQHRSELDLRIDPISDHCLVAAVLGVGRAGDGLDRGSVANIACFLAS